MPVLQDIDLFGSNNADGTAVEYFDSSALSNALQMWLSSSRGEFLKNPGAGGPLDSAVFKRMDNESLNLLAFSIRNNINNFFAPSIELQNIIMNPDYDTRSLEITIEYINPQNREPEAVTVYVNSDYATKSFEYEDVAYVGENLYNFCIVKKIDLADRKMIYAEDGIWTWAKYRMINLTNADPYFDSILLLTNGS